MSKYIVETFYTCSFKIIHKLDVLNEKKLSELENRNDGEVKIIDVKLNNRKTKTSDEKNKHEKSTNNTRTEKATEISSVINKKIAETGKFKLSDNSENKNINDPKLSEFQEKLNLVLLNLAKRVVADGEGASKFITIKVLNCRKDEDAKKIAFSIANSPLVKTAITGEDPNWGRIIMAIGKANIKLNTKLLNLEIGNFKIIEKGELIKNFDENNIKEYMKQDKIDIQVDLSVGNKNFTAFTMDLTKKYIDINSDYRS